MVVEFEGILKMHHSFNGVDAPGDTQPDSQMHKEFTSGIFPVPEVDLPARAPTSLFTEHEEEDDDEDEDDLPTDEEEVAESSQQRNHIAITSPTVVDVDDRAQVEPNSMALTSPLKFETPALANRKRDTSARMLSSAARTNETPGTVASASAFGLAFGNGTLGGGPAMSLTQAWHNTQAPTSPAVGETGEDAVFSRPSPNFTNVRHSSPMLVYSSPIKGVRPETPRSEPLIRSSSEPRVEYVTMEQSQEKRRSVTGNEILNDDEQDSWEDLSRKVRARIAKEQFHRKAAKSLSHISAPILASTKSKRSRGMADRHSSPLKSTTPRNAAGIPSLAEAAEDSDSTDEPSQSTRVKGSIGEDSSDDSECIPSTEKVTVKWQREDHNIQVPKTSSHPQRTPSKRTSLGSSPHPSPSSQLQRESQVRASRSKQLVREMVQPRSSADSIAVLDSQPDINTNYDSIPQPKSIRFPSSPSTNQYSIHQTTMATRTGYTSQVISSSMPPMPPKSSIDTRNETAPADEERVPSSPPLYAHEGGSVHEGDLEYDEHTYDEYVEGVVDAEVISYSAMDEDAVMGEEDDLPTGKPDSEEQDEDDVKLPFTDGEPDLDLIQPQKVDLGTDPEIPDTLPHDQYNGKSNIEEMIETDLHSNPVEPKHQRGLPRQNTVPETDALDETQPSFFPEDTLVATSVTVQEAANQTNSTEVFQTAHEELSISPNNVVPGSSKEDGSDTLRAPDRIQSLSDVHNLPETQQSQIEEEIEMPRLSGFDEDEDMPGFSPKPPPAKRRKVTYTAKRNAFRSPIKSGTDSDSLSDPPPSSPEKIQAEPEASPSRTSTRTKEDAGSHVAAPVEEEPELRYTRQPTRKSLGSRKPSKPLVQKQGALKPVPRELLQGLSSPADSPSRSKRPAIIRTSTPATPSRSRTVQQAPKEDDVVPDVGSETDELAGPTPQPTNSETLFKDVIYDGQTSAGSMLVPNRVFASWPGEHYYPATCVGRSTIRQLRIRFDDGNVTSLDATHVRALDLRRGDHVKVDEKGMKKHTYVVVGFKDRIDDLAGEEFPMTDRLGFATVVLEEKRNESLPQGKALPVSEHISVPMASIYLPTGLWARLRDRPFTYSPLGSPTKSTSGVATPITENPALGSFTRRGTAAPSLLKDSTFRATSVASTAQSGTLTFAKMAFVLTSTAADIDKERLAKNIKRHGGLVLELGFHELFEYEDADPPSSQSRRRSITAMEDFEGLTLKNAYRDLGFVALISDAHSRSTKYIQALALNVPCLHLRWVEDSLSSSRALPFSKYLLPAGVSKFLDPSGVIRSRTMNIYDPSSEDLSFAQTIQDRDFLLQDQAVLLVTGKSKKEIEKRQPFIFLMHALGSRNVGQCPDLTTASALLHEGQWDWVYVDNGEKGVAEAAREFYSAGRPTQGGTKAKKGSKKRKRDDSEEKEEIVARGDVNGRVVRITSSEFVIQSLISGALVEE